MRRPLNTNEIWMKKNFICCVTFLAIHAKVYFCQYMAFIFCSPPLLVHLSSRPRDAKSPAKAFSEKAIIEILPSCHYVVTKILLFSDFLHSV